MTMEPREVAPIILLADANILSRHAIADYLRSCGHTVLEAANLEDAQLGLKRFANRIELALCDVTSLGTNGIPELIGCADNNQLLLNFRFLAGFESVARAAVALSSSGDMEKDTRDLNVLVSYILYAKAKLSCTLPH